MAAKHSFLLAAACGLPLSLVACGGSSEEEKIIPEGTHYGYVVSSVSVPTDPLTVAPFSLDLGSKSSSKPDGVVDNALGKTLAGLTTGFMFDIQGPLTAAIDNGSILLLIDFQTKDFATSNAAGFSVKIGANPTPAPCTTPTDCRHHLDGTGSFTVAPNSPTDALVAGKITSGTFKGGPGDITLQIALGTPTPITLNLLHARVQATTISETGIMTATVGGLLTQDDLNTQVGPAITTSIGAIIERDCPVPVGGARVPPDCNCKASSTALTVLKALDGKGGATAKDCQVTLDEVLENPFVQTFLQPESCSTDSCKTPDALSIGVKVQAVKATFPM
jgi:hypothetical protein